MDLPKIAIVTAYVGQTLVVPPPAKFSTVADYYFFCNLDAKQNGWTTRPLYPQSLDEKYRYRRGAKLPKLLSHHVLPDYDYYFWHDVTFCLEIDPFIVLSHIESQGKRFDACFFPHPWRNCVYDEASEILRINRDHSDLIKAQMEYYKKLGYPDKNGLYEATCFIRKNNPETKNFYS